jgi:hypothetical protein
MRKSFIPKSGKIMRQKVAKLSATLKREAAAVATPDPAPK